MKRKRQNRGDILLIALIAMGLGIFNLVIERVIDGALCIFVGICALLFRLIKRRK